MSATLEALASMVEARNLQRAQQDAMRRAQQANAQQGQQGAQQGQQGAQQGAGGAQGVGGAQQPGGAQGGLPQQQLRAQQLSAQELGQQFRQNHQAGQSWGGFNDGARPAGQAGQATAERGAEKEALYRKLLEDKNVKEAASAGKKPVDFTESSATRASDGVKNALDPARATRDTGAAAARDALDPARGARATGNKAVKDTAEAARTAADNNPTRGTGTTRNIRGFREISEEKLKAALPDQAKHLAKSFIEAGRKHNIDPVALAGISGHETGNWTSSAFRNKNNAMGISNRKGPIHMPSAEASIERMAKGLADPNGYYKNAKTLADIGKIYAPIGAGNDPRGLNNHWTRGVSTRIDRLERAVMS